MFIESDYMGFGLFGQIFSWILDILPYCDSQGWNRAVWNIKSRSYGEPPDYNIFPSVLQTVYAPESEPVGRISLEELHWRFNPKDGAGRHFCGDFRLANKYWTSYFRLAPVVVDGVDEFCQQNHLGLGTLGVHYRGTDQFSVHCESTPVTVDEFLLILDDFLKGHPDIKCIFAASDESRFMDRLKEFANGRVEVLMHYHARSKDGAQLYLNHDVSQNLIFSYEAIRDCVTLSRCQYCLANFSALSAWTKVLNPELSSYRISACKISGTDMASAFPHGYAPRYLGNSEVARELLQRLQCDDWQLRSAR
jgi:hypothetical protein